MLVYQAHTSCFDSNQKYFLKSLSLEAARNLLQNKMKKSEIDEPTAKRQCTSPVEGALLQVTVEGCGLSDINGVYKQTDRTFHGAPEYSKEGII